MGNGYVVVMGCYVADVAFRTRKLPAWGETYMGNEFKLGQGKRDRTRQWRQHVREPR